MPRPMNDTPRMIHAVVFLEGELWVAQCLEVDLAISSRQREQLPRLVRNQLRGQVELDRRRGRRPFSSLRPAPPIFHTLYQESRPWQEVRLDFSWVDTLKRLAHRSAESMVSLAMSQRSPAQLQRA